MESTSKPVIAVVFRVPCGSHEEQGTQVLFLETRETEPQRLIQVESRSPISRNPAKAKATAHRPRVSPADSPASARIDNMLGDPAALRGGGEIAAKASWPYL